VWVSNAADQLQLGERRRQPTEHFAPGPLTLDCCSLLSLRDFLTLLCDLNA
jgi:hypothetical protein